MLTTNPFSVLAETVPSIIMQGFVVLMILLIVTGTLLDIFIKRMLSIFLKMQKKQKKMQLKNYQQVKG